MILTEHKIKHGNIKFDGSERVLSFGVDKDEVYFWCATKQEQDKGDVSLPEQEYSVLHNGDEVPENFIHVATLVEGTEPKHIFAERRPEPTKKEITKLITSEGVEVLDQQN